MRTHTYGPVQWPTREPARAPLHDDGGPSLVAALRALRAMPVVRPSAPARARPRRLAWWRFWMDTAVEPGGPDE
jgi:hypothetical protein